MIEADLKDAGRVREAMVGCDTIFHLAANPDIAKAISQPDIDFWEGHVLNAEHSGSDAPDWSYSHILHLGQRRVWRGSELSLETVRMFQPDGVAAGFQL